MDFAMDLVGKMGFLVSLRTRPVTVFCPIGTRTRVPIGNFSSKL